MWAHTEIFARKALYTGKVNVIKNIYRESEIERERERVLMETRTLCAI